MPTTAMESTATRPSRTARGRRRSRPRRAASRPLPEPRETEYTATWSATPLSARFPRGRNVTGQDGLGQRPDCVADEDLARPGQRTQSGGDVDGSADVAIRCLDRLAGVDPDADGDRIDTGRCLRFGTSPVDDRESALDRVTDALKTT